MIYKDIRLTIYFITHFYNIGEKNHFLPDRYKNFYRINLQKIGEWFIISLFYCLLLVIFDYSIIVLKPFGIEYPAGAENSLDASTVYDAKDLIDEDKLIALEDTNVNASVNTQNFTISKKSGEDSANEKNIDWENYELVETNKPKRHTEYLTSVIIENVYLASNTSHGFYHSVCHKDSMHEKESLPVIQNSTDSKYLSFENEFNLVKDAVYYSGSIEDKRNDNSRKYDSIKNVQQKLYTQHISTEIFDEGTFLGSNATHNIHDLVSVKDNLHLEDQEFPPLLDECVNFENDSQYILCNNLDCINKDFLTADTVNTGSAGQEKAKYRSKFNLSSRQVRKSKHDESLCDKTENCAKRLSFKNIKIHPKSVKDKLLKSSFKK